MGRTLFFKCIYVPYVHLLLLKCALTCLSKRSVFKGKKLIFVNFRAFGHSIFDSYCVYESYGTDCLILSIGEVFERNSSLNRLIPANILQNITLASWHRNFKVGKNLSLRKYIGPSLTRLLQIMKKMHLLENDVQIKSDNVEVLNDAAILFLKQRFDYDEQEITNLFSYLKQELTKSHVESSLSEGSLIFLALMNQVSESEKLFSRAEVHNFKSSIREATKLSELVDCRIFVLIISDRGKPWNGIGLDYYLPTIDLLLSYPDSIVFCLGDIKESVKELREANDAYLRVLSPYEISFDLKLSQFLAIYLSELSFGDGSGVWSIFNLIGKRGVRCNTLPGAKLYNRCLTIPRPWKNSTGGIASSSFYSTNLQYSLYPTEINGIEWKPTLLNPMSLAEIILKVVNSSGAFPKGEDVFQDNLLYLASNKFGSSRYFFSNNKF